MKSLSAGFKQYMHIGFDDTDSTRQGCTTYVAALLVEKLEALNVKFLDYPRLIRLNPNVPWKTRGNGALCLTITYDEAVEAQIKAVTVDLIESHSDLDCTGTAPGIVFLKTAQVPQEINLFSKNALTRIVTVQQATELIRKCNGEAYGYNTQQGIVGALAAIGETLTEDYTYELIAYRTPKNCGTPRQVDTDSIFQMDTALKPYTFNNVDFEKKRVIITPRGPDPILFGIRGETSEVVKQAFHIVKPFEPVERWMIFRSNQGTDAHLNRVQKLNQLQPYSSVIAKGVVSKNPQVIPVRHVVFSIQDETAEVDCAAYEPTGDLRKAAKNLAIGDIIEAYGAVKKNVHGKPITINLEKINLLHLAEKAQLQNPLCSNCGKRLKSMGKNQGLRCEKCKNRFPSLSKTQTAEKRNLVTGLYVTSTRSQRHLTKPLRRYGLEKYNAAIIKMVENWHSH